MGKVLLNISILNKNYCIFEREKGAKLNASFYDKKTKAFGFVTNEKELRILNEVICMLNRKYVRRKDIVFNDENFIRYVNKYTGMSYFARMENGTILSCPYLDYKELYNEYNCKQVFCMPKKSSYTNDNDYDFNNSYESYGTNSYWDVDPIPRPSYKGRRSNSGIGIVKKVLLSIAGVSLSVVLCYGGYTVLSTGNLPEIETAEPIIDLVEEAGISPKNYDTIADTEQEQALKARYDSIAEQLKIAGIESNWELAVQLDLISLFEEDAENISFYYDSDKDEVVYIYDNLTRKEQKPEAAEQTVSQEIQRIITAITENNHLTPKEKEHIISTYTPIWVKNEKYLNIYELINRFSMLETTFDFKEGGALLEETHNYNPHKNVAGTYSHMGILANSEEGLGQCYQSLITIYDSSSFEETLKSESTISTYDHETNHVNGALSYYTASLLNEGYNQLAQANSRNRYKTESAMAMLCIETFGTEAFKEGFYGFDLQSVLTNKIVGITKRNSNEVDKEIADLLQDIEDVLYKAGKDENYRNDAELLEQFENVFRKLGVYHELITGREMEDNQTANLIKDYIIGSRKSSLYTKDTERLTDVIFEYDVDTGVFTAELGAEHEMIPYSVSFVESQIAPRS